MDGKRNARKRPFEHPRLTRYGQLGRITMASGDSAPPPDGTTGPLGGVGNIGTGTSPVSFFTGPGPT